RRGPAQCSSAPAPGGAPAGRAASEVAECPGGFVEARPSAHGAAQEGPRLPGRVAPGHPLAADQPRHDLEDGPLLQEHDLAARDGQDLGRARGGGEGGALQGGVLPEAQLRAAAPAHRHDGEGLDAQRAPDPRPLALLGRRVMGGQRG
ncbi:unnamed protein product, partial [Prorocentrum cordatum]